MLKTIFKISLRNFRKQKINSFINILGFTIGIASCLFILLYILHEKSYDRFFGNSHNIYRLGFDISLASASSKDVVSPAPAAATFKNEFPEVVESTRLSRPREYIIHLNNRNFKESKIFYADDNFFDVFDFTLISGERDHVLKQPNSAVLTEEMVFKYFGNNPPLGETIVIGDDNTVYKVTGVVRNPPDNTHLHFNMLLSMSSFAGYQDMWGDLSFYTYIVLKDGASIEELEAKLPLLENKYIGPHISMAIGSSWDKFKADGNRFGMFLQPLTDIHLYSNLSSEIEPGGNPKNLYIFSIIAIFILLIACINFMNLSTARSQNRAGEVGVRKVLGSSRNQLVVQFIAESLLYSALSMILAIGLVQIFKHPFENLSGTSLNLNLFENWWILAGVIILATLVGLLAGSYPAFYLTSFQPIEVLKGENKASKKSGQLRHGLVVFQFAISIALIVSTILVYRQLSFVRQKNLGFDKENTIIIKNAHKLGTHIQTFKQSLVDEAKVINASVSSAIPGYEHTYGGKLYRSTESEEADHIVDLGAEHKFFSGLHADYDYLNTMKIELVSGRNFSPEFGADSLSVVINQVVARQFGWDDPIGKWLYIPGETGDPTYHIIGMVKDYHFESLHNEIKPLVLYLGMHENFINVRLQGGEMDRTLAGIEEKWYTFAPHVPFEFSFLDQDLDALFRAEQRFGQIFSYFTGLAIFIACLGLFGLAIFAAEQRTKEIGVRKILGSSIVNIIGLLTRNFLKWVLAANLIAWPIAWYAMNKWLQNFAYRINIGWGTFFIAAGIAVVVAFFTVAYQAVKAATANPVEALRYE